MRTRQGTYEDGVGDGAHAWLELPVEELAQAGILLEVRRVDLVEVATKNPRIEFEAVWAEPHGELEGIEVSPDAGKGVERKRAEDVHLVTVSIVQQ